MSEDENERVVQKIFEAWNRHDLDTIMDHFTDDVTVVWADGTRSDKEGTLKHWSQDTFSWCPDTRRRVDRMVSQGNTVVVEWTFMGTHKGEVLGVPATNKKVEIPGVWILVLE